MTLCEIRIPTYRRPEWLKRALQSIQAQDTPDWRGIIFDDSPDQEGRAVVEQLADMRFVYRPNNANLGAAANIDQCFRREPYLDGEYACILEDDNWLLPSFISSNIQALTESGAAICLRNQIIWHQFSDHAEPTTETTLGSIYSDGVYDPPQICARLFIAFGISQGGLFWSAARSRSNLMVGPLVRDSGLSEVSRTLKINEPVVFRAQPQCVFARMDAALCVRSFGSHRAFGRGLQAARRHAVRVHGPALLDHAAALAEGTSLTPQFEANLLDSLIVNRRTRLPMHRRFMCVAHGLARRWAQANPLKFFLRQTGQIPPHPSFFRPDQRIRSE